MKASSWRTCLPWLWFAGYVVVFVVLTGYVLVLLAHEVAPLLAAWIPIVLSATAVGVVRWWSSTVAITVAPGSGDPR